MDEVGFKMFLRSKVEFLVTIPDWLKFLVIQTCLGLNSELLTNLVLAFMFPDFHMLC